MRTRSLRIAVAALAVAASLTVSPERASATTVMATTFVGTMSTPGGMGDRCTPVPNLPNCLFDEGNTSAFGFNSTSCIAMGAILDFQEVPVAPVCDVWAYGVITGYCGEAHASGAGHVRLILPLFEPVEYDFTWQLDWFRAPLARQYTVMALTGSIRKSDGTAGGAIVGRLGLIPDPTAGSCLNSTATRWLVEANMAFEIVAL